MSSPPFANPFFEYREATPDNQQPTNEQTTGAPLINCLPADCPLSHTPTPTPLTLYTYTTRHNHPPPFPPSIPYPLPYIPSIPISRYADTEGAWTPGRLDTLAPRTLEPWDTMAPGHLGAMVSLTPRPLTLYPLTLPFLPSIPLPIYPIALIPAYPSIPLLTYRLRI